MRISGWFRGVGRRLRAYRKEWDEAQGVAEPPWDDDASHGADAFLTFASSNYTPPALPTKKRDMSWVV